MSRETDTLIIQRVKCGYVKQNESDSSIDKDNPIHIKVDWIEVKCKGCGNECEATSCILPGPTCFHEVIGELMLLCSECGMQHAVPAEVLCN